MADGVHVTRLSDHISDPTANGVAERHSAELLAEARRMQHNRSCCADADEVNLLVFESGQAGQTGQCREYVFHSLTEQRFSQVHGPHRGSVIAFHIRDL